MGRHEEPGRRDGRRLVVVLRLMSVSVHTPCRQTGKGTRPNKLLSRAQKKQRVETNQDQGKRRRAAPVIVSVVRVGSLLTEKVHATQRAQEDKTDDRRQTTDAAERGSTGEMKADRACSADCQCLAHTPCRQGKRHHHPRTKKSSSRHSRDEYKYKYGEGTGQGRRRLA